jgi:pilus assembly protein CpaF
LPGSPGVARAAKVSLIELTRSYEDGFLIRPEALESAIDALPGDASYVVDAPQPIAAALRPFAVRALQFLVVTEPTLLGVNGARHAIAMMNRAGIPNSRIAIVLNVREAARDFKRAEIETALNAPVLAEIPPQRERGFARTIGALADELERLRPLEPIDALRLSATTQVGDRRMNVSHAPATRTESVRALGARPVLQVVSSAASSPHEALKGELTAAIMSRLDFGAAARMHTNDQKMNEFRAQVDDIATELLNAHPDVASVEEAAQLKRELIEETLGLGPIESLLNEPGITEIMVNGSREVYIERDGAIQKTTKRFVSGKQVRLVIERILAPLGRRIDEASPMVDARLPDGSRVNAIIEPLSVDGPTLTIRRFGVRRLGIEDLVSAGAMTPWMVDLLRAAVAARLNVVVSGGTGAGKTTLLGALSSFISRSERIVTIEDAAELLLDQPHVVRLESRPANLEGRGEVRIRELVRNALRMRPDRIVVGECRGAEALDMLQAMNTGHDGSLTTLHANTPRDALFRIETMVLTAGFNLPVRAIREQISSAIDIIVQVSRMRDGSRKIVSISEVVGMEGDVVTMQEIVRFRQRGLAADGIVAGEFEFGGVQPMCLDRFAEMGVEFDLASLNKASAPMASEAWAAR